MTTKYKLVPIEPTEEMIKAGEEAENKYAERLAWSDFDNIYALKLTYKAMLEAAPAQDSEPVAINAKPLNWSADKDEWMDEDWGMHIALDDGKYSACWGEGDTETFETLEEAKQWCQLEADSWIKSVSCYAHPPADKADAERYRWLKHRCVIINASNPANLDLSFVMDGVKENGMLDEVIDKARSES